MYTHRVKIQLNPNSFIELSRRIQAEIMPWLYGQKGFCRGVTTVDTQWRTATADTFWESRQFAEDYHLHGFPELRRLLSGVGTANPAASIFEDPAAASINADGKRDPNKF